MNILTATSPAVFGTKRPVPPQSKVATTPPSDDDRVTLSFNASKESVGIGLVSGGVGAAIGALVGRVAFGTVGAGIGAVAGFAVVGSGMFLMNV